MKVVLVADIHIGSNYAVADPDVATSGSKSDREVRANLYAAWKAATKHTKWGEPDALISVGDAVDGKGFKSGGVEQWEPDLTSQADHAADLISMWKAREYYVIIGSPYHVAAGNTGIYVEELMARKLNAMPYPYGKNQHSGFHWFLTMLGGTTMHVAHHVGISRVFAYRSTPIAREMMGLALNDPMRHVRELESTARKQGRGKLWEQDLAAFKTTIVVRAHAHYSWICIAGNSAGFDLPCWSVLTPYMQMRNPVGMLPDIGFVGMEFNEDGTWSYEMCINRVESMQRPPHTIVGRSEPTADHPDTRARRGNRAR